MLSSESRFGAFDFRCLKEIDYEEVLETLNDEYLFDEPVSSTMGLSIEEGHMCLKAADGSELVANYDVSLVVRNKETNKLAGFLLSKQGRLLNDHTLSLPDECPLRIKQLVTFSTGVRGEDLSVKIGTPNYMQYSFLHCNREYRHNGIATELCRRSEDIARKHSIKKAVIMASSYYTQRIAKKLGFRRVSELDYRKYVDPLTGVKIFEQMKKPHDVVALDVKDL